MTLRDIIVGERSQFQRLTYYYMMPFMTFSKANNGDRSISGYRRLSVGSVSHYKGKLEGFLKDDGTVLYPVCGGGYANVHVLKFIELKKKKFIELYTKKKKNFLPHVN